MGFINFRTATQEGGDLSHSMFADGTDQKRSERQGAVNGVAALRAGPTCHLVPRSLMEGLVAVPRPSATLAAVHEHLFGPPGTLSRCLG